MSSGLPYSAVFVIGLCFGVNRLFPLRSYAWKFWSKGPGSRGVLGSPVLTVSLPTVGFYLGFGIGVQGWGWGAGFAWWGLG